jgi:predicted permease
MSAQKVLIAAQLALSLILMVTAGLLVGTLQNYLHIDLGFEPEHVMSVWITPRASGFQRDRLSQLYRDLVASVEGVPGVRSASVAVCGLVVGCDDSSGVDIDGYDLKPGERISLQENQIGLHYFNTVGMRLVEGREFNARDTEGSQQVAIVNRAMVRRYFGGQSPIGRRFGDDRGRFEVVGVVEDARVNRVQDTAKPMAFYPLDQMMRYVGTLEVRAAGDPQAMSSEVRRAVAEVDRGLPIDRITMLSRQIELNLSQERLVAQLASFFGLLALGLACVGLCGVMSYLVSRRTTEFGIRLALGASSTRLGRSVMYDTLLLTAIGLAVGVPAILAVSRVLAGLLFGITPTDPLTIIGASLILVLVAIVAALIPAWRASRVDLPRPV